MRLCRLAGLISGLVAGLVLAAGLTQGGVQAASQEASQEAPQAPRVARDMGTRGLVAALRLPQPDDDHHLPPAGASVAEMAHLRLVPPHLKDSYWLSVNYGMVEEAKRLGVALRVVEAGGYPNLERQIAQITECARDADILALGAVSFDGLTEAVLAISQQIPVLAVVNDIADPGISAKAAVSWVTMGAVTGAYLASLHPAGTPPVKVAWFPGPRQSQWAPLRRGGVYPGRSPTAPSISC